MDVEISRGEYEAVVEVVRRASGMDCGARRPDFLLRRLSERMTSLGVDSLAGYLPMLAAADAARGELGELINLLCIPETFFFRDEELFEALRLRVVPELVRRAAARGGARRLLVWSAACATGEEAYSLAMVLEEALSAVLGWSGSVLATDISAQSLAVARTAAYRGGSFRQVLPSWAARWFTTAPGGQRKVVDSIRNLVELRRHNLVSDLYPVGVDLVLCRNVLMYFRNATALGVLERLRDALVPGGCLVIGEAEQMRGEVVGMERWHIAGRTIWRKA
ncbi:MAG: protein-glutamate O-methyltransferase CheR [Candidatus Schekmanbacteria bacterium]|nr:protein-glutamate O-methyltransferase CheR [Candidatus Schekmanbacteria bacterium]